MAKPKPIDPKNSWKQLSSRVVYKNTWMEVREDDVMHPNGKKGIYGYMVSPPAVFVVALNNKQEIYLISQPRYTSSAKTESIELPAGSTDGDEPLKAAKRELQEETGLISSKWKYIGQTEPFHAFSSEVNHFFIAYNCRLTAKNDKACEGITDVFTVNLKQAFALIDVDSIRDGQTITGITKAALHLKIIGA
jgi:8-oxo-dGTP pyrophosphatase MutT (NUDIX family)